MIEKNPTSSSLLEERDGKPSPLTMVAKYLKDVHLSQEDKDGTHFKKGTAHNNHPFMLLKLKPTGMVSSP